MNNNIYILLYKKTIKNACTITEVRNVNKLHLVVICISNQSETADNLYIS